MPGEPTLDAIPGAVAPEACLGFVPSAGLTCVAALAQSERAGAVVDQDGTMILTARVLEVP